MLTGKAHVADDSVLAMLDAADVLEESVHDEQNDESEERHHSDHRSETAGVAVAVVAASILVPALARDAAEHDHRKQLRGRNKFPSRKVCVAFLGTKCGAAPGNTNLLVFLESVTTDIDAGRNVDTVYLDLAKAFDKVPHQRPLIKLKAHGI